MSAEGVSIHIRNRDMHMEIRLSVHLRDTADDGCDFERLIQYGLREFLRLHIIEPHHEMIGCPQSADGRETDLLLLTERRNLRHDLLIAIHTQHDLISKSSVIHPVLL